MHADARRIQTQAHTNITQRQRGRERDGRENEKRESDKRESNKRERHTRETTKQTNQPNKPTKQTNQPTKTNKQTKKRALSLQRSRMLSQPCSSSHSEYSRSYHCWCKEEEDIGTRERGLVR
jgi:hypothetical protein